MIRALSRNINNFQMFRNIRTLTTPTKDTFHVNQIDLNQYSLNDNTRMRLQSIMTFPSQLNLSDQQKIKLLLDKLEITEKTGKSAKYLASFGLLTAVIPICTSINLPDLISIGFFGSAIGLTNLNLMNFVEGYYLGKTNHVLQEIQQLYQPYQDNQDNQINLIKTIKTINLE